MRKWYKAIKGATSGVNKFLKTLEETFTKAGNCFVAGTEILTVDGVKNIEDIQVGDFVIADDPTTPGGIEGRRVLETFVRETDTLYDLYVDGEVISTTGEHPFWVPDKGWVEAKDLVIGSLLQTEDGRIIDVDGVEKREGKFEVYNFKVEDFHTYFVSDLGILVHNADCSDKAWSYLKRLEKSGKLGDGKVIRIENANGGTLPEPPAGYPEIDNNFGGVEKIEWYYHDVFVKDNKVRDPMGLGHNKFVPFEEWTNYYGGPENLNITTRGTKK